MKIVIREIVQSDMPAITALMRDFAGYENLLEYFEATADDLDAAMFGDHAFVKGLVAENEGRVVGYAIFYPNYATFRGQRGLYLEDIYIEPGSRGKRLGERMIRQIARIAKQQGCKRIDFQVLEWNAPAIGFYEKLGAHRDEVERHFKFTDEAFQNLAD